LQPEIALEELNRGQESQDRDIALGKRAICGVRVADLLRHRCCASDRRRARNRTGPQEASLVSVSREVFEAERPKLVPYAGRFDGFHAVQASVSKTCLVRFDNNKYSVAASAVGRSVEVHAYADRIVIR
jgi:hypothetical protein